MKELDEDQKKYVVELFEDFRKYVLFSDESISRDMRRFLRGKGLIEPKLEVGRWYMSDVGIPAFNLGQSDEVEDMVYCYGFDCKGDWFDEIINGRKSKTNKSTFIRPATDEEVKKVLITEAKKRGFSNGSVKCKFKHQIYLMSIEGGYYKFDSNENLLSIGGTYIFKKGEWAEVEAIPSYTMEEAFEKMGHEFKIKN